MIEHMAVSVLKLDPREAFEVSKNVRETMLGKPCCHSSVSAPDPYFAIGSFMGRICNATVSAAMGALLHSPPSHIALLTDTRAEGAWAKLEVQRKSGGRSLPIAVVQLDTAVILDTLRAKYAALSAVECGRYAICLSAVDQVIARVFSGCLAPVSNRVLLVHGESSRLKTIMCGTDRFSEEVRILLELFFCIATVERNVFIKRTPTEKASVEFITILCQTMAEECLITVPS
jgi:hypothetical protein